MDFFGILEFLNGLGMPLPLCVILVAFFKWLLKMTNRIDGLEKDKQEFARKHQLKNYVRCDICEKTVANINMANTLGENLNAERLNVLDVKVDNIENKLSVLGRAVVQLRERLFNKK